MIFYRSSIWENIYIKDIIIWFLFSGLIYCMNAVSSEADERYIQKVLKDNLKLTMILEFFMSTFTFNIWIELAIIPIITIITVMNVIAERKEEYKNGHKLLDFVLAIAGFWILYETIRVEEGMKYQQIGIPPEEAQFLETRKFQINEIARLYRIPPHMVGDLDKSSFSNIEQQSLEFVKYTLDPWVIRWEQSLQRSLLLPGEKGKYFIKLNVDGLLRGDYQSRMNGYAVGRQNGWFSANDIREMENMNPIPDEEGGNLYLINGAMTKLADAGAFAKTDTGQQNTPAQENSGKRGKR